MSISTDINEHDGILIQEQSEFEALVQIDVSQNAPKSQNIMISRSKNHSKGYKFEVGGKVIIKKDFDTNLKTKNMGLDTNHFSEIHTITEVHTSSLTVKSPGGEISIVSMMTVTPFFDLN